MITEEIRQEIQKRLKKYANEKSAVMDALRIVQRAGGGNITKADMEEIARIVGVNPVAVNAVAAFYTMYNYGKPVGRYHIQVCRNISCALLDAERIIEHLEKRLKMRTGETTRDSRFTLSTVECLGSCGTAPMMQINDDYYENLTPERVDEILDGLE
ncbi:MAG TPA: NADH-quinone oxidoreductase subunit NuoE [Thermodesulfobacteriota bacterium]|nr:NADH-quinone oxidoreductase subunit NuoE [Thermodesulfobacteriota bacterium]